MSATPTPTATAWPRIAGIVVLLTVITSALLTAFAWPAVRSSLHDVPIALAGPAVATDRIESTLQQRQPGAFAFTHVADTAAAEAATRNRDVYGAIDLSTGTPQVITATAASPILAQTLQTLATALSSGGSAATVAVHDVAALPDDDPRGTGFATASLPLALGGLVAALLLGRLVRGTGRKIAGALAFAVAGGLALAALLQFWFGSLSGDYWVNSGALALSLAATAVVLLGLNSLLGYTGLGIGTVIILLIGNPLAGTTSAPEMLPGWSGRLGQLLPPGAGGSLLRSTAFFDGNGAGQPVLVLACWLALGILLCVAGGARTRVKRADLQPATAG